MTILKEKKLEFTFDDSWIVLKYDEQSDYLNKIKRLNSTKAVDFIGVFQGENDEVDQYFIEVKDFTAYEIENKKKKETLPLEVALKVRDTAAGLVGISKTTSTPDKWNEHLQQLFKAESSLKVILFVKNLRHSGRPGRKQNHLQTIAKNIKANLKWLTTKVSVVGELSDLESIHIKVQNLPRG